MSATVVVTGAARGIGAAIAQRFTSAGWDALLVDLDPTVHATAQRLRDLAAGDATALVADVSSANGLAAVAQAVDSRPHPLGALVNNAGITRDALLKRMSADEFRAVVRVNLGAAHQLTQLLLDPLRTDGGGAVVNLSSKSASGNVGQYNYAVSKAGLLGLTRSLALQLAPDVRVNAVAPAFIATEMTAAIPDELRERFVARIPFGRPGEPEEVAETVFWLASPAAAYVTGQVLPICGGRSFAATTPAAPAAAMTTAPGGTT